MKTPKKNKNESQSLDTHQILESKSLLGYVESMIGFGNNSNSDNEFETQSNMMPEPENSKKKLDELIDIAVKKEN